MPKDKKVLHICRQDEKKKQKEERCTLWGPMGISGQKLQSLRGEHNQLVASRRERNLHRWSMPQPCATQPESAFAGMNRGLSWNSGFRGQTQERTAIGCLETAWGAGSVESSNQSICRRILGHIKAKCYCEVACEGWSRTPIATSAPPTGSCLCRLQERLWHK